MLGAVTEANISNYRFNVRLRIKDNRNGEESVVDHIVKGIQGDFYKHSAKEAFLDAWEHFDNLGFEIMEIEHLRKEK